MKLRPASPEDQDFIWRTQSHAALIEAEDEVWMQDLARMLCLGDEDEADELVAQWRNCVAEPDPDDFGWDEDDDEFRLSWAN